MLEQQTILHTVNIVRNESAAEALTHIVLKAPELAAKLVPGQFLNLEVPGNAAHLLRVPLSYAAADTQTGCVELLVAEVGDATRRLATLPAGTQLSVLGPLGKGWFMPDAPGRVLLLAGGVGVAPVLAAASWLAAQNRGFDCVLGARTEAFLWQEAIERLRRLPLEQACDCARRVLITTDDGSCGLQGFVTDAADALFAKRNYTTLMACGPEPMLCSVAALANKHGIRAQVSLERMMGCGFGVCNGCNVAMIDGSYRSCCKEGPVFEAQEVAW